MHTELLLSERFYEAEPALLVKAYLDNLYSNAVHLWC